MESCPELCIAALQNRFFRGSKLSFVLGAVSKFLTFSDDEQSEDDDEESDDASYSPANQFVLDLLVHLLHSILLTFVTSQGLSRLRQEPSVKTTDVNVVGTTIQGVSVLAAVGSVFVLEIVTALLFLGDGVSA